VRRAAALILLLAGAPAGAEELKYIPKWHMSGGEACYDLRGAKELVLADKQLSLCETYKSGMAQLGLALEGSHEAYNRAVESARVYEDLAARMARDLELEIAEKNKWKAKANSGPGIGWLVAGGLALTLTGLLVGKSLSK
jgi:hypothetical protein